MKQATLHLKNAFRTAAILAAVATLGADSQIHGKYCTATAPAGWRVTAENKQKVAFGADLLSGDGQAAAG